MAAFQHTSAYLANQPSVSRDECETALIAMRNCLGAFRCILDADGADDHDREAGLDFVASQIGANLDKIREFFFAGAKGKAAAA
jgi:hypothetical protein